MQSRGDAAVSESVISLQMPMKQLAEATDLPKANAVSSFARSLLLYFVSRHLSTKDCSTGGGAELVSTRSSQKSPKTKQHGLLVVRTILGHGYMGHPLLCVDV